MRKKKRRLFYFFGLSNCFFFAFYMWITRGGYCSIRRSMHITGWHWVWEPPTRKHRRVHYEPKKAKEKWWLAIFHKLLYKGVIKRNDDKFIESHYIN